MASSPSCTPRSSSGSISAKNRSAKPGVVSFDFVKEERRVGTYYFYIYDAGFGPGFVKICTYFPYPAKVWLLRGVRHNSHYASARIMSRGGVAV